MPPSRQSTSTVSSGRDSHTAQEHCTDRVEPRNEALASAPPWLVLIGAEGQILSLGWPLAAHYGLDLNQWLGHSLADIVASPQPCWLQAQAPLTPFDGTWQLEFPTCQIQGSMQWVASANAALGQHWVGTLQVVEVIETTAPTPPPTIAQRLTQLTWNIRRTLDLETIGQQTVEELSDIFPIEWGMFCICDPHGQAATVVASTQTSTAHLPLLDCFALSDYPALQGILRTRHPAVTRTLEIAAATEANFGPYLIVATRHQGEMNGLLVLKAAAADAWAQLDLGLFRGVAEQVGTAIAHAHLFCDAQGLADELQAANQRLRHKHRELEEARHQAEEASRLKSEFLANTSHELRTPLNGMIGFLRLILDGMADDPEEQDDFLQEAHKSAIHLLNLINDVLDIAKIEAGKMQIDMSQVKLRELFADLENFTRPQAEQKGLQFAINLPSTRDEIVINGNYQRLLQVLLNLVGNAIKFTHEGNITISAEIKSQKVQFQDQEWPGYVKVSVADTGIGVSLEKQDRLFQTFSQVDGERTRQYGGTGLGLAISQRLIEAMGGVVQFISMGEGLGSTVTFTTLLYQEPVLIE